MKDYLHIFDKLIKNSSLVKTADLLNPNKYYPDNLYISFEHKLMKVISISRINFKWATHNLFDYRFELFWNNNNDDIYGYRHYISLESLPAEALLVIVNKLLNGEKT